MDLQLLVNRNAFRSFAITLATNYHASVKINFNGRVRVCRAQSRLAMTTNANPSTLATITFLNRRVRVTSPRIRFQVNARKVTRSRVKVALNVHRHSIREAILKRAHPRFRSNDFARRTRDRFKYVIMFFLIRNVRHRDNAVSAMNSFRNLINGLATAKMNATIIRALLRRICPLNAANTANTAPRIRLLVRMRVNSLANAPRKVRTMTLISMRASPSNEDPLLNLNVTRYQCIRVHTTLTGVISVSRQICHRASFKDRFKNYPSPMVATLVNHSRHLGGVRVIVTVNKFRIKTKGLTQRNQIRATFRANTRYVRVVKKYHSRF